MMTGIKINTLCSEYISTHMYSVHIVVYTDPFAALTDVSLCLLIMPVIHNYLVGTVIVHGLICSCFCCSVGVPASSGYR